MNRQNQRIFTPTASQNIGVGLGQSQLRWSSHHQSVSVSGKQDLSALNKLKNVILSLRKDWSSQMMQGGIQLEGHEDYSKRLILAEKEIEGILKRKINYSVKDAQGGQRVLDFSNLLNEKENQIVELEKKIQNLESKLRKGSAREQEFENYIVNLTEELKKKDAIITLKHESALAEVASGAAMKDALTRIRKNIEINKYKLGEAEKLVMNGVEIPDVGNFDIKIDVFSESRSKVSQGMTEVAKNKTRIIQLFREFERLVKQQDGFTDVEVERILEGFITNMAETKLCIKTQRSMEFFGMAFEFQRLQENFSVAATIFADIVEKLKREHKSLPLPKEVGNLFELLKREKVVAFQVPVGNIFVELNAVSKVVEVPVQDARTKHLIHLLSREFKRLFFKYPKIQTQIDGNLAEFLQQEIIDVMEVDEMDRLIEIVKIKPEVVKVENVYVHNSEKQRKKEFHLRILIKTLLEELEKIKLQTGVVLTIDEGVLGMIRAEIMDTINVDDILKVFKVNQKIVEVERIVEKIVERVVEVPKVVTVERLVQKIVEVEKVKEVERIVHVPIDKPLIVETQIETLVPYEKRVETIVEVPTIVEKLVELQKVVPEVMEIELIREKIVEVEVPIEVEKIINHIQTQIEQIEVVIEKVVPVEQIVEKIVQVPVIIEKIVEKIVEVPKIIEVEKIVEKIVKVVEYRNAKQVENHIETKYQVVDRIVERLVPIVQIKERIKEVPQEIQVIKQVTNVVTEIKEVEVIREKLVVQQEIKEVERVETRIVEAIKEVLVEVEKFIEVPIIKEIPVIKEIIIEKAVISKVESVHLKEIVIRQPLIVKEPVVVEVEKFINVYVDVPKTIKYIEEKVVEVPTIVDRIKEVPVTIEKIIEKMVEVPKVVEVEKVVEKIVVVPRVIEKVIEVPQFVEKIITKEVIREKIIEIEKIIHIPVIQEVIKEIEIIKNVYIEIEKPIDRVVERHVEVPKFEEKIITKEIFVEVPVIVVEERAVQLEVEKVVPLIHENIKTIQIDRQVIVPIEIAVPVELVVEKIVPKVEIIERVIPVPQIVEKIVPVVEYVTEIQEIQKYVERILIEKEIKEVEKIVPYIQEIIKEVPTIIEKIVAVEKNIDTIVTVERIIEKVIEKTVTLPQIYQVERIKEKLVEVPKLVEIERIVPQIIRVNQYIHKIAEKLVELPTLVETIREVVREQEKIVPFKEETVEIVQVERFVEKLVYAEKLKEVVRNVNYIEKVLQIVDRIEHVPVTVAVTEEKFVEVPYILEKIVEKIVIMPQIVEVLKYIHEVCESDELGVAVDIDVGTHEAKYRELSKNIEKEMDLVLKELRYLKSDQVTRQRIEGIQKFLEEMRVFILTPRIVKVVQEKVVEVKVPVDKIVNIPTQDEDSLKMELSLSVLVEKLIGELRRVKQKTGVSLEIDDDIKLIFFNELESSVPMEGELLQKLQNYSRYVNRQFSSLGAWTVDQELMLKSFLQERFLMAEMIQTTDIEMESIRLLTDEQAGHINKSRGESTAMVSFLKKISVIIKENRPVNEIVAVIDQFEQYEGGFPQETTVIAGQLLFEGRMESLLREKDANIVHLKDVIYSFQKTNSSQVSQGQDMTISVLKGEIDSLRSENTMLQSKASESGFLDIQKSQIVELQDRNLYLQSEISRLKSEIYNLEGERSLIEQFKEHASFRRDPQTNVHEVEARESGFDKSRFSQSSQGRSLTGYQGQHTQSVIIKPGDASYDTTVKKAENVLYEGSRLSDSGSRGVQSIQGQGYQPQPSQVSQNLTFSQGAGGSALSQSQNRQTERSLSQYAPQQYQGGSQIETSQFHTGQGEGSSSGLRTFGVEDSQSLTMRATGVSQVDSRIQGTTQNVTSIGGQGSTGQGVQGYSGQGVQNITSQGVIGASGVSGVSGQGGLGASNISQQSRTQATTLNYPGQSREGQQGGNSGIYGGASGTGIQSLFASRTESSQAIHPSTQTIGGGQLQGSQVGQGTSGSIQRTPIEGYKFASPSPSGVKMTQSIIKQEQSLSKVSANSPATGKTELQKSQYQYYTKPEKKEDDKRQ